MSLPPRSKLRFTVIIPAGKWESGPEFSIFESDLLVSWGDGPSRGMEGKTRSKGVEDVQ